MKAIGISVAIEGEVKPGFSRGGGLSLVPRLNRPSTTHPHLLHVSKGRGISRGLQLRRLSPSEAVRPVQRWKIHHRQEARVRSPSPLRHSARANFHSWGHFSTVWLVKDSLCVHFSLDCHISHPLFTARSVILP